MPLGLYAGEIEFYFYRLNRDLSSVAIDEYEFRHREQIARGRYRLGRDNIGFGAESPGAEVTGRENFVLGAYTPEAATEYTVWTAEDFENPALKDALSEIGD